MNVLSLADAALEYAHRGWRVFPVYGLRPNGTCECGRPDCGNKAKHPRLNKWPQEATTEEDKICWWWRHFPSANIGITTGSESGIIVLDVDVPDALDWTPKTLTSKTGRGLHFYFAWNGIPVKNSVGKLGDGLDIRGEGGFVVAPPSRHASGRLYQWLDPTASIEVVPAWVVTCDPIPNGKRNDTLFKRAAGMRGYGEIEDVILNTILEINQRCVPPLPESEIREIVASTRRYSRTETGSARVVVKPVQLSQPIAFPQTAMTGSMGELAALLAEGTEVPEEFYYAAGLTVIGSLCAGNLRMGANVECEPRLYTILLGQSADVKKSTALRRTIHLFQPLLLERVEVLHGVGSAEGLARTLAEKSHVLLCYDELKALMDKASIEGSALLAITASMFENTSWSNPTKYAKQSIQVNDGHLSLLGCCTTETYGRMWTSEAISIGLPNRLFIMSADRKRRVAWPQKPNQSKVRCLVQRIRKQLATLPKTLGISSQAKAKWEKWYLATPVSEHAKRLDTLGFRLMGLIALTNDKEFIDVEAMDSLIEILDYELRIRQLTDPIDADNQIARLEEKIRRTLAVRGPLGNRDLQRYTSAHRTGLWAFEQAICNLKNAAEICLDKATSVYFLVTELGEQQ